MSPGRAEEISPGREPWERKCKAKNPEGRNRLFRPCGALIRGEKLRLTGIDIYLSQSFDMIRWGEHRFVMSTKGAWQGTTPLSGPGGARNLPLSQDGIFI